MFFISPSNDRCNDHWANEMLNNVEAASTLSSFDSSEVDSSVFFSVLHPVVINEAPTNPTESFTVFFIAFLRFIIDGIVYGSHSI